MDLVQQHIIVELELCDVGLLCCLQHQYAHVEPPLQFSAVTFHDPELFFQLINFLVGSCQCLAQAVLDGSTTSTSLPSAAKLSFSLQIMVNFSPCSSLSEWLASMICSCYCTEALNELSSWSDNSPVPSSMMLVCLMMYPSVQSSRG